MRRLIFIVSVIALTNNYLISQELESPVKKNVVKGSAASSGIINGMISIDYERNIHSTKHFKLNIEGTYGKYYQTFTKDTFQSLPGFHSFTSSLNTLIGKKSHFFEFSIGARYSIIQDEYYDSINPWYPVMNIGYRYQNPLGTGIVFKSFLGYTGIGISLGKSF